MCALKRERTEVQERNFELEKQLRHSELVRKQAELALFKIQQKDKKEWEEYLATAQATSGQQDCARQARTIDELTLRVSELKSQVTGLMTQGKLDQPPKPDDVAEKGECLWCKGRVLSNQPRGQVGVSYFHRNGICDKGLDQKLGLTLITCVECKQSIVKGELAYNAKGDAYHRRCLQ